MARLGNLFQFRRNTLATIQAASGTVFSPGEPVWATDTGELFIADGTNTPARVSRSYNGVGNPGSGNLVMPWNIVNAFAASALTSGTLPLYPIDIWPGPLSIKALACQVTTAQVGGTGTLNQAVLYRDNGTGAGPLVTSVGLLANVAVTATTTGIKLVTVSLTLTPGRYWAGMLYYAGTTAPTTAPQYYCSNGSTAIWAASTAFQSNRYLLRSGLTAVPTDGVAFVPNTGSGAVVGVQAN